MAVRILTDQMPSPRRDGESADEWHARCAREWPETMKTLRLIALVDENQKGRIA